ncbi:sex-determining region Y protein isoform X3 [Nilaparvata lugens]|uniref:sex-determining region Y protein isoform X3 n=1 Tax=Nilaparvata lugens TaxID=108931 RepID=UPI00193E167C|nr:sex-determining region Y protein isoform X3 [Nilaparvata lugens]
MRMRTNGNHETPNTSKTVHNKTAKLMAHPKTFPTVQTHVKVANMRDLRQDSKDQKIPRPPNAFMLFANDFRRKLAGEFPKESNKDISIRLGCMWKSMEKDIKDKYFQLAKEVDAAHKKKYPDYVYNPKEARLRKAIREKSRAGGQRVQGGAASSGQRGGAPASWSKPRQNMNSRQPICMQMVGDQQQLQHRQLQHQQYIQLQQQQHQQAQQQQQQSLLRCNNRQQQPQQQSSGGGGGSGNTAANMMLQNYNDYLDLSYHHVAQAADYTLLPEHHQSESSWYSSTFLQQQGPDQTASSSSAYPVRSESRKVAESHEWSSHFATESNSAFIHTSAENSADKDASRSEELVDSAGRGGGSDGNGEWGSSPPPPPPTAAMHDSRSRSCSRSCSGWRPRQWSSAWLRHRDGEWSAS